MNVKPKAKQIRVKHVVTGEINAVTKDMAERLVASGDWEYVEGD